MIFLVIVIAILVIFLLVIIINTNNVKGGIDGFKKHIESNHIPCKLEKVQKKPYQFALTLGSNTYALLFISIPDHSEIILNSKTTWELRYGAGNTPGKIHPYKRYLTQVPKFLNSDESLQKIVIFTPAPKKIAMYINECEMKLINPSDSPYGITIINDQQYAELFKNLTNNQ